MLHVNRHVRLIRIMVDLGTRVHRRGLGFAGWSCSGRLLMCGLGGLRLCGCLGGRRRGLRGLRGGLIVGNRCCDYWWMGGWLFWRGLPFFWWADVVCGGVWCWCWFGYCGWML